jgi:hypothetical protein
MFRILPVHFESTITFLFMYHHLPSDGPLLNLVCNAQSRRTALPNNFFFNEFSFLLNDLPFPYSLRCLPLASDLFI